MIAYFLSNRTHSLLLGEAASPEDREQVIEIVKTVPGAVGVKQLLSMHLGPKAVVLALKVEFARDLDMKQLEKAIDALERAIRGPMPHMRYIFVEPDGDYTLDLDAERPIVPKGQEDR